MKSARKYCLLVRNYSYSDYSYLIRNVMNYITLHIAEDLSLTAIADYFSQKSLLSLRAVPPGGQGENLSVYIQKERMQTAIRYFNITNMSVAEVAGNVGIHDSVIFQNIQKAYRLYTQPVQEDGQSLGIPRPSEVKPPTVSSASAAGRNSSGRRSG